ncbi:hypothetical protein BGZ60DRAFT_521974 [Tricladium varicosporioides]|nr:hypothetical protein BGZ60DRAFT_521974 [Hymenoscyphus varicosporioides]
MASLPRLDTSRDALKNVSGRNSYTSATDSASNSARNSYASISDSTPASSRTSYSSIPESLGRVSSFSRTSDSFLPDSVASTPLTSRDSSPDSPIRWARKEGDMITEPESPPHSVEKIPLPPTPVPKDGPSTLRDLKNVQNVICVAFGAFDKFYISWEDTDNQFHQECNKLPESLQRWLFPDDGSTRHLPSLQVSFGSNDDFFASDQFGKLSSRDAVGQLGETKPVPKLAEIARGIMRKKAHTVSSPTTPPPNLAPPESPKLERRRTFMGAQPALIFNTESKLASIPAGEQLITRAPPVVEQPLTRATPMPMPANEPQVKPQLTRLDSKSEMPAAEHRRRRSILIGVPPMRPAWPEKKTLMMAKERILAERTLESAHIPAPLRVAPISRYVDAGVQTEPMKEKPCEPIRTQLSLAGKPACPNTLPPQHQVPIGSMQHFFRSQYSLGDALRYV